MDNLEKYNVDRQTDLAQKRFSVNKKSAMTLAEVLLTLGIIGVLAAMTIPPLITNTQNKQYVTALKKVYSNFNQVLVQYSADQGCLGDIKCTGLFNAATGTTANVGAALAPYFRIAENCKVGIGCFSGNMSETFDGSTVRHSAYKENSSDYYKFTTIDGAHYALYSSQNNCFNGGWSSGATGDLTQLCGELFVDVNGEKGPNNFGRDIFDFYITNGRGPKLYPSGGQDDFNPWNSNPSDIGCSAAFSPYGYPCSARVIEEGWEMNY